MHGTTQSDPDGSRDAATGDLALLLEAEARFARVLEEAERTSELLLSEANAARAALDAEFQAQHAQDVRELEERLARELGDRLELLRRDAEARAAAWSGMSAELRSALVSHVLSSLLAESAGPGARAGSVAAEAAT